MYDVAVFDFDGVLFDGNKFYPCVESMLENLRKRNVKIFLASYNPFAGVILRYNGLNKYFIEMLAYYDGKEKVSHLSYIMSKYGIDKSRIVFFDDVIDNVVSVSKMGITSYLVENGYISWCSFF